LSCAQLVQICLKQLLGTTQQALYALAECIISYVDTTLASDSPGRLGNFLES